MYVLSEDPADLCFPTVDQASPEGLLAIGGDLSTERLLEAYRRGIFPWYSEGQPTLWWSPDPRTVLFPHRLRVSRSLRKTLRNHKFRVTLDTRFGQVIGNCALPRDRRAGASTWITGEMITAYCRLHQYGAAHSVEAWLGDDLAGGLYGVALGRAFFGESMFSIETDSSKVAFVHLVRQLEKWGYDFIDCQMPSAHLARLGAKEIHRREFLTRLEATLTHPDRLGRWRFDLELKVV